MVSVYFQSSLQQQSLFQHFQILVVHLFISLLELIVKPNYMGRDSHPKYLLYGIQIKLFIFLDEIKLFQFHLNSQASKNTFTFNLANFMIELYYQFLFIINQQIILILIARIQQFIRASIKMSKHYSEVRKADRYSQSKNIRSQIRNNREPSRDSRQRSRDDAKSKHSNVSARSNRSGPTIFGGNVLLKKQKKVDEVSSEILSRPEFQKPQLRNKNVKDVDVDNQYAAWAWQQAQKQTQMDWYEGEEGVVYDQQSEKKKLYETQRTKNMQAEIQQRLTKNQPKQSLQQKHRNEQHTKWQQNQLVNSGIFKIANANNQNEENQENRVVLMVHDLKPPFLDGNTQYSTNMEAIEIVKDPNSDMAILAKKGSVVVKELRERNQRTRQQQKQQKENKRLKGMIEKKKQEEKVQKIESENADYKQSGKFAALLSGSKLAAVSDFARNKTIKEQRQFLPVFEVRDELRKIIRENKVVIIVGETGSGKTTQLTQYLYQDGYWRNGVIGCTQPRRVAAVSVAKRVADQVGTQLGKIVGYSIRFQDTTSSHTVIKYMTDGVLLRESLNDGDLETYSAIIMDEAHERSLNTDVLFGILKKVAQRRTDIKVIITSATMNAQKFSQFFGNAPIFEIPGRTFPVQKHFEKSAVNDYVDAAVKKALAIHISQPMESGQPGDILIFMTGQQDIEASCKLIEQKIDALPNAPKMLILPIYSQLRSQQQAKIFEASELRKCIVATNIAETSLTLDGVRYVIDTGFCKLKVYNPRIGMDALQITPISQANANQRAGRAGRTGPGHCYRLYSANIFRQQLFQNNIPQIQRTNLCNVVLLLKSLNIDNLLEFQFMDPPPQDTMLNAMYQLWILGALDNLGHLTHLGRQMAEFPVDPPLSKMIIVSNQLGCLKEIVTIVSMLSVPSIFYKPKQQIQQAEAARQKLLIPESDHLTYLNIYQQWSKHNYSTQWATQHFLQPKSLNKVKEVRSQLMDIASQLGFKTDSSCQYNYDLVRKVICSGYFINAAKVKGIGDYVNMRTGVPCRLHMSSALLCLGYIPEYVVYHELIMTSKQYMSCVTTVDPYWLAQLGPMFFSVRGQISGNKSKAQLQKQGQNMMAKQLQQAKRKKKEEEDRKKQKEENEKKQREQKSGFVVEVGRLPKPRKLPIKNTENGQQVRNLNTKNYFHQSHDL